MHRQLLITLSFVVLLAGWLSAFLLKVIPQQSDLFYLVPALLLGVGVGLMLKVLTAMRTAIVVAITAILAIVAINQFYPQGKVSFSGFLEKMEQPVQAGMPVPVKVQEKDNTGTFAVERELASLSDIEVNLFSRLPGPPRMLAFRNEQLYVSIPKLGAIYMLEDRDLDGFAELPVLFHAGLDRPHGLAWHDESLFVAETSRLLEVKDLNGDKQADEVRVVLDDLPDDGGHWTRSLALGDDKYLYLSIGSRCNACEEVDKRRAAVLRVDPRSGDFEIFASGLRNTVGLAFAEGGKTLWGSDNGRDFLGDDLPPDEINQIIAGGDYGWPNCFGQKIADPELGKDDCQQTVASTVDLPAHSAPLGLTLGTGLAAPTEYRNSLYVAFHGSWNRSVPTGYKLVRLPLKNGRPNGPIKEFLFGWLENGNAWGRPVAPIVGPDGNLYLSDDFANAVYRISWQHRE